MPAFIYPVKYYTNGNPGAEFGAPNTTSLAITNQPLVCILTDSEGIFTPGMYQNTGSQSQPWKPVMPIAEVSKAIINGDSIEIFYNISAVHSIPSNAVVYKNGVIVANEGAIPANIKATFAIRIPPAGGTGSGSVNSINGVFPDPAGNVILDADDVGAIPVDSDIDEGLYSN